MKQGQLVELLIESTGINGEGVAKFEGVPVFVPFALPGEKVKARVVLIKKKFVVAQAVSVLTPAEVRDRPACPVFTKCGGCQLQHIKYSEQLRIKTGIVRESFKKIAKLNVPVNPTVKSDLNYGYRNKLQLPVGTGPTGHAVFGFFLENSNRIVPITHCPLHPEWNKNIIAAFSEWMHVSGIKPYDRESGSGDLRHVVVKSHAGKMLIIAVTSHGNINSGPLVDVLKKRFKDFGLYVNINPDDTNVIMGGQNVYVYGSKTLVLDKNKIEYEIGPASFMQVNPYIKDRIYGKTAELLENCQDSVIIDAYSGAGLLSALLAKNSKRTYAIELCTDSHENSCKLAKRNKIDNMISIMGDCSSELPALLNRLKGEKTVLVLDPPRKGCSKEVIAAALKALPEIILYISCNPATLARDAGFLMGTLDITKEAEALFPDEKKLNGLYDITLVQPYDMFPQTKHVETLVCFKRR